MDFENANVLQQLRCGGVLEAVRISCAGFPTKFPFEDFVDHFWNLVPELLSRDDLDDAALAKAACQKAKLQGFQIGKTKVWCMPQTFQSALGAATVRSSSFGARLRSLPPACWCRVAVH